MHERLDARHQERERERDEQREVCYPALELLYNTSSPMAQMQAAHADDSETVDHFERLFVEQHDGLSPLLLSPGSRSLTLLHA